MRHPRAERERLVQIRLQTKEGRDELVWAKRRSDASYEIKTIPTVAGYHVYDLVRCDEDLGGQPVALEVVRPSGHRALRVEFVRNALAADCDRILARLRAVGLDHVERLAARSFLFDLPPTFLDGEVLRDLLEREQQRGILAFDVLES